MFKTEIGCILISDDGKRLVDGNRIELDLKSDCNRYVGVIEQLSFSDFVLSNTYVNDKYDGNDVFVEVSDVKKAVAIG